MLAYLWQEKCLYRLNWSLVRTLPFVEWPSNLCSHFWNYWKLKGKHWIENPLFRRGMHLSSQLIWSFVAHTRQVSTEVVDPLKMCSVSPCDVLKALLMLELLFVRSFSAYGLLDHWVVEGLRGSGALARKTYCNLTTLVWDQVKFVKRIY